MDKIKKNDSVLGVWNRSSPEDLNEFLEKVKSAVGDGNVSMENSEIITGDSHPRSKFDVILSNFIPPHTVAHTDDYFKIILNILKPNGVFCLRDSSSDTITKLKLNGFINVDVGNGEIVCNKPNFEVGSSMKLGGNKIWKIDNAVESIWSVDNDDDIINSDDLLDENDIKKTDAAPPKVCGTTGLRKACADCSCGLAEELRGEKKEEPKSSCGSCYLGDAFRCSGCPYLGMPAFKPGEKVLLADLKPDI